MHVSHCPPTKKLSQEVVLNKTVRGLQEAHVLTLNSLFDSSQSGIGSVYIQSKVVNLLLTEPTKL